PRCQPRWRTRPARRQGQPGALARTLASTRCVTPTPGLFSQPVRPPAQRTDRNPRPIGELSQRETLAGSKHEQPLDFTTTLLALDHGAKRGVGTARIEMGLAEQLRPRPVR